MSTNCDESAEKMRRECEEDSLSFIPRNERKGEYVESFRLIGAMLYMEPTSIANAESGHDEESCSYS